MDDLLVLVNEEDEEIGYGEKMDVHKNNALHRAFSIFIFDWSTHKMLLQRRAFKKYHSGGLWTNACCSHPHKDEDMETCLNARLKEELGLNTAFHIVNPDECGLLLDGADVIYSCDKFLYSAFYGDIYEHEIDNVYLYSPGYGDIDFSVIEFNRNEIEELKWVTIEELRKWMEQKPEDFTAWFKSAFELAYEVLCRQARNMDMFLSGSML